MSLLQAFVSRWGQEYRAMKLDLHRMRDFLQAIRNPEKTYPSVLIAGTNGKGSTSRMLEAALHASGYRVGLYSSPHLLRFTERIRVGAEEISKEKLECVLEYFHRAGFLDREGELRTPQGEPLTWFEKVTALALEVFRQEAAQISILEVGLGGRLDATNIVDPLLSAITSISRDHAEVLGDSLFEIAREKAGVMRAAKIVVLGAMDEPVRIFLRRVAHLEKAVPILTESVDGTTENFSYRDWRNLSLGLEGGYQLKNAAVALDLLQQLKSLGFICDEEALRSSWARLQFPGRLQYLSREPAVLLEGAHNEAGWRELRRYLEAQKIAGKVFLVFAAMRDKEPKVALEILGPLVSQWIFTEVGQERQVTLAQWRDLADGAGVSALFVESPELALEAAKGIARRGDWVVVAGSLYLVGKFL